ncbi:GntR family transcriptional regulator [Paraburkholderia ferrariae]|uniref:GntR family transcriptional regulator n=1 Tax=Paraburkholderia ferrariae TaxID=386056 RepID=UPI00047F1C7D|nr:GntR family transcriptional regulator [Paraburkholderia ferrariae]
MTTVTLPELDGIDFPAQIAAETRKLINRGTLAPGFQLRQSDLADRFGISRVPVREALKLLAAEGIIEHDPNRGFFVAQLSSDEARQLYRMRNLLEAELLASVTWPTAAQLKSLRTMLAELNELLAAGDRDGWIEHHRSFHDAIFDLSPNKVLKREVLRLLRLTDRYRALAADVTAQHGHLNAQIEMQLVKALETKNRELLLGTYDKGRTMVLEGLMAVLAARGA